MQDTQQLNANKRARCGQELLESDESESDTIATDDAHRNRIHPRDLIKYKRNIYLFVRSMLFSANKFRWLHHRRTHVDGDEVRKIACSHGKKCDCVRRLSGCRNDRKQREQVVHHGYRRSLTPPPPPLLLSLSQLVSLWHRPEKFESKSNKLSRKQKIYIYKHKSTVRFNLINGN